MEVNKEDESYRLEWKDHQGHIKTQFETLRCNQEFTDVTILCQGQQIHAHRIVLSASSPIFKDIFKTNPCPHPIIFMQDVEEKTMEALLQFIYAGVVCVNQENLDEFLKTAKSLKIQGLTENRTASNDCTTLTVTKTNHINLSTSTNNTQDNINSINKFDVNVLHENNAEFEKSFESMDEDLETERLKDYLEECIGIDECETNNDQSANTEIPQQELSQLEETEKVHVSSEVRPESGNATSSLTANTETVQPESSLLLRKGMKINAKHFADIESISNYKTLTRVLTKLIFTQHELATSSLSGRYRKPGMNGVLPPKRILNPNKLEALIAYVVHRFPNVCVSNMKQIISSMCKSTSKLKNPIK